MSSEESTRAPALAEMVVHHITRALEEVHTCLPGVVTEYDATLQRATVKPLVQHAYYDETNTRRVEAMQPLPNVPVQFMAAGGFALTCPISTGNNGLGPVATTGLLIFSEASLDAWKSGSGADVDPAIDHRHALPDAVFIPGLQPFGAPLAGVPADHAALGAVDGVRIHLRTGTICIGDEGGSKKLVLDGDPLDAGDPLTPGTLAFWLTAVGGITGTGYPGSTGTVTASSTQAKGK